MENEEQRKGRNKATQVNWNYINSGQYRKRFDMISATPALNRLLYQLSKQMLKHRAGTKYEDMYWIDIDATKVIATELNSRDEESIHYSDLTKRRIRAMNELGVNIMTIHTHPNSFPPSINDINSNFENSYHIGIVICHNGTIYMYSAKERIDEEYYCLLIAKYLKRGYNEKEAQIQALRELQSKFKIYVEEVMDDDYGK